MIEHKLDVKILLEAVAILQSKGDKTSEGYYVLNTIKLDTGIDGYNAQLSNNKGSITVNFHNTLMTEFDNSKDLDLFYKQLKDLVASH